MKKTSVYWLLATFLFLNIDGHSQIVIEKSFKEKIVDRSLESNVGDEVVSGILIASKDNEKEILLRLQSKRLDIKTGDSLWLDQMIKHCLFENVSADCEPTTYIDALKSINPKNGLANLYTSIHLAREENYESSLSELKLVLEKPEFNDFYWNRFLVLLNVLEEHGYPNDRKHMVAINYGHNLVTNAYNELIALCKRQSSNSLQWKDKCISVGNMLVKDGGIFYANMVGYALQREALSNDPSDKDKLEDVKDKREALHQWRIRAMQALDYIDGQKKGPDSYYKDLINFGETRAVEIALSKLNNLQE